MKERNTSPKDITGQLFGKITALSLHEERSKHGQRQWDCECACGKHCVILQHSLTSGNTKSCGIGNCKSHRVNNEYTIDGDTVLIDISTPKHPNTFSKIDIGDFDLVINKKNESGNVTRWMAHANSPRSLYAVSTDQQTKMHRLVTGAKTVNQLVDHLNGNGIDNRRCNLRVVTSKENSKNCRMRIDNTSGATGVTLEKSSGLYVAEITVDNIKITLGRYDELAHANIAYRAAAKVLGFSDRHGL